MSTFSTIVILLALVAGAQSVRPLTIVRLVIYGVTFSLLFSVFFYIMWKAALSLPSDTSLLSILVMYVVAPVTGASVVPLVVAPVAECILRKVAPSHTRAAVLRVRARGLV